METIKEVNKMGRKSGKPGPDPRNELEKAALRPFPKSSSFGGPHRPPLDEVKSREEQTLEDFFDEVRGEE
jgi:hypothetical protein